MSNPLDYATSQIKVDYYRPGDEVDILALNRSEYGPTHMMINPEDFQWRYADNPAGKAKISVVRDENTQRVIGFTWMVPMQMRLFGRNYLAAFTANLLIHPNYRQSMAYVKLIRHRLRNLYQNAISFRYNFPIQEISDRTRSIEKQSSFPIPLLIRPLNMPKLAQNRYKYLWQEFFIGWGGHIVKPLLFYSKGIPKHQYNLKINWIDQFDERFDEFWKRVQDKYAIMVIRDSTFLAWRFASVSTRSYRILVAMEGDELVGYIVLRCTDEIQRIPIGLIMDFLVESGSRGEIAGRLLLAKAWHYFQKQKVWLAGGLGLPHTAEYHLMRDGGYLPCPQKFAPRLFRVAFNSFDDSLPDTTDIKTSDWFLTISDYEAH